MKETRKKEQVFWLLVWVIGWLMLAGGLWASPIPYYWDETPAYYHYATFSATASVKGYSNVNSYVFLPPIVITQIHG